MRKRFQMLVCAAAFTAAAGLCTLPLTVFAADAAGRKRPHRGSGPRAADPGCGRDGTGGTRRVRTRRRAGGTGNGSAGGARHRHPARRRHRGGARRGHRAGHRPGAFHRTHRPGRAGHPGGNAGSACGPRRTGRTGRTGRCRCRPVRHP